MANTNRKKESHRLSVMLPRECKQDIEYIIAQTGIKSNGELFRLMLTRYREDFINAYLQFFNPRSAAEYHAGIEINSQTEDKLISSEGIDQPITGAMSF